MVNKAKEYIKLGDIFQVVLSQRFEAKLTKKPLEIYKKLRITNPSPFMFYFNFSDFQIIGASPEILVRLRDNKITVRPIAGTRPRGKTLAQDFEKSFASSISNSSGSPTTIVTSNSDDALISIRLVNKHTAEVTGSVVITSGGTTFNVIKDAPIPVGGSLELIDSGSKIVIQNGDVLKAYADTASAVDCLVSFVDTISS